MQTADSGQSFWSGLETFLVGSVTTRLKLRRSSVRTRDGFRNQFAGDPDANSPASWFRDQTAVTAAFPCEARRYLPRPGRYYIFKPAHARVWSRAVCVCARASARLPREIISHVHSASAVLHPCTCTCDRVRRVVERHSVVISLAITLTDRGVIGGPVWSARTTRED